MENPDLHTFYEQRRSAFSAELNNIKKRINLISNARLATALVLIISIYFTFKNPTLLYLDLLLVAAFVVLVKKHAKDFEDKTHLENLVKINESEIKSLNGDWSENASGADFIDGSHAYAHDLDIFGEGSLFQYINRCNTLNGKNLLASRLTNYFKDDASILQNQETINEINAQVEFRQNFQAAGMSIEEQAKDREQLLEWSRRPSFLYGKKIYKYALVILPLLTIVLVIAAFFNPVCKPFAILLALTQWGVLAFNIKEVNAFHEYISKKKILLKRYARLLYFLRKQKFNANLMQTLMAAAEDADQQVQRLSDLVSNLNARLNPMMNVIVNSLLLYDLQCVYRLEEWKNQNAEKLKQWLDAISESEVLCSFANFAYNNPDFNYATIEKKLTIRAMKMGHPLIAKKERITNDITIGDNESVLIVTGANMAGKSTFLRTLGVNLVLALNGAPVCASKFSCPVIDLRTGMRTADSLKDNQSYFYAELNRLKTIMDELRSDKPLLILLDEILKGTNSTDKQAGSIALVKQLLPHPCLGIIATHDLALGQLEDEFPRIKNYCFEPTIVDDQLYFDYKLKRGLAQKMNATFLMKKMGIIPN